MAVSMTIADGSTNGSTVLRLPPDRVTSVGGLFASGFKARVIFVSCGVPSWVITSSVNLVTGRSGSAQILVTRIVYLPPKPRGQT